jgi:3-oxoacyl-[acyl-carrier-protein] synthase II
MNERICITGLGVCSSIGNDLATFTANLKAGSTGIRHYQDVIEGHSIWAGLVSDSEHRVRFEDAALDQADRASHLAIRAARQAWQDAFPQDCEPSRERVGLVLGTSHGGRSQLDEYIERQGQADETQLARNVIVTSPHHQQTEAVAFDLGIHGPVATLSTACSSGGAALSYAVELLRADKADYVLAGGMDGFSKLTWAGFHGLGAVAHGPCSPFSSQVGISLGEGSGIVVLETLEHAQQRKAKIYAELLGYGLSWDCHHITEPHPAGEGLQRAFAMAAGMAGITANDVDYISLHGTGTRANDGAETLAVKAFFGTKNACPPASAVKSLLGHTLGASGALGFIAALVGMREGFVAPTVNFQGPRPGCDLDYTPNTVQAKSIENFCCLAAGFGGANNVIIGSSGKRARGIEPAHQCHEVAISGIGIISPIGLTAEDFTRSLRQGRSGIATIERFSINGCRATKAGLVRGFDARRLLPTLDFRRMDPGTQYAAVAAAGAIADAQLANSHFVPERIGLVVGTALGAAGSFDRFLASVNGVRWERASAAHFPNMVMSSIGGHVSKSLGLKGIASTLVGGTGSGLHAFIHAVELLRRNQWQDAVVVVVTDEIAPLFFYMLDRLDMLANQDCCGGESLRPYDPDASVCTIGEGAVAFVLEHKESAAARGKVRAVVRGSGLTADAAALHGSEPSGAWLERAARIALKEAQLSAEEIDVVYGQGRGVPCHDHREVSVLNRLFGGCPVPITTVTGNTGLAESASGAFNVAAAVMGMQCGEVYPIVPGERFWPGLNFVHDNTQTGNYSKTLLMASTENGNNAALVLGRPN